MRTSDQLVVVGDRFAEFLANLGTIADSELSKQDINGYDLIVGQGLSAGRLDELAQHRAVPVPARRELTHKRLQKNVMIGEPSAVDGGYAAPLVLDEHSETLEDHLTGQHIPAIALTEAARQMWTVVTEMFFLAGQGPVRFVIEELRSRFSNFVFPLPTTLVYQVHGHEQSPLQQLFHGTVTIRQSGVDAAEFDVHFRVIDQKLSAKQEAMAARQALTYVKSLSERSGTSPAQQERVVPSSSLGHSVTEEGRA